MHYEKGTGKFMQNNVYGGDVESRKVKHVTPH